VLGVDIAGRRYPVHRGWNTLQLGLKAVPALSVHLDVTDRPGPTVTAGIRELQIPGVHATEALRPPVIAEHALAGQASAALMYVFQRTTGDDPFRRDPWHGASSAGRVRDRGDGESGLERVFSPPTARRWTIDGWVTAGDSDSALDALVGVKGRYESSARFEGRPGWRASSAFDGTPQPWIGSWQDGHRAWIEWDGPQTVSDLTLDPVPGVRRPTRVRLIADGVRSAPVNVGAGGTVHLPPTRGNRFRLEILRAAGERRAVGIAEIHGVPPTTVPRTGRIDAGCDYAITVGSQRVALRVDASIADLDAGRPLRAASCAPFDLPAGQTQLSAKPATFVPYVLRLRSGEAPPVNSPGRVVHAGTEARNGTRTGLRLALTAPARLVLAESYNRGRRAACDGSDLGVPGVGDGYGTAWPVPASCRNVTITFAPNRLVDAGYVVSILAALLLIALLIRGRRDADELPVARTTGEAVRMSAGRAALLAVPVALFFGFVFAARALPLFWVGVFYVLWRGVGSKRLALAGGALLGIAVPVLTVIIRPQNRGGYNPEYAIHQIAVHWVAVAGVALFFVALGRELALSRATVRRGPAPDALPSAGVPPGSGP